MPTNPNDPTVLSGAPVARAVTRLGRYSLKQRLGVGGMAEVYLAEQEGPQDFKKRLVIKRILPSLASDKNFVEMFTREARVAAVLSHPNVVQIYELGEQNNGDGTVEYFIAMEYIDGLTLQRLATASWQAGKAVPLDVVVRTTADAARGLHAAHTLTSEDGKQLHLVHRDISPDNLMVSKDGVTKVLDFGIAKGDLGGPKTRTGNLRGKVPYMSPEQITGQELDGRCDLWALGVSIYWLLCGERPFDRGTDFHTMQSVLYDQPKPPSSLNPAVTPRLEKLILSMLQKDRGQRPKTGADVADELEEMASAGSGAGRRTTVAFVEQHLRDSAGQGNPLSESGDKTANTRPLPPQQGGLPSTEVHDFPTDERALTVPRPEIPHSAQRIALVDVDGNKSPRKVTMPDERLGDQAQTGPAQAAAPPPTPQTPNPASKPAAQPARKAGNHPVVDMLAPPKQASGAGAVIAVIVGGVLLLGGGGLVALKVVSSMNEADAGPVEHKKHDAGVAAAHDAGLALAAGVDAGALNLDAGIVAVDAGSLARDAGAAAVSDAGVLVAKHDAGMAPIPSGPIPTAVAATVAAKAPARIVWRIEGGTAAVLGRGNASFTVPAGTARITGQDPDRGVAFSVPIVAGKADYGALPTATIVFKQVAGVNVFLLKDFVRDNGAVSVPAPATYMVLLTKGQKNVGVKKLAVKPGETVYVDAAHP